MIRSLLFVCMGNICRSPTAEGVFRRLLESEAPELGIHVDSAGTHAYHIDSPPDSRSQAAALRRGVDLSKQRARIVRPEDFERFDLLLAMDRANLENLKRMASEEHHHRVRLFLEFGRNADRMEVPDPYYGGSNGFEEVLDLVEDASRGLLAHILASRSHD